MNKIPLPHADLWMRNGTKMAAGEQLNFKTFVARRKAEYSLRFPFLTERQILAKLRKVWKSQKGPAVSRGRKREPGMTQGVTDDVTYSVCYCAFPIAAEFLACV